MDTKLKINRSIYTLGGRKILNQYLNQLGNGKKDKSCSGLKKTKNPKCVDNKNCKWVPVQGCKLKNSNISSPNFNTKKNIKIIQSKIVKKPLTDILTVKKTNNSIKYIKKGDPEILKIYMNEFIHHFENKNDICFFWAFKILELSNPEKKVKKKKKKIIIGINPGDLNLSLEGEIKTQIKIPHSLSDQEKLLYTDSGSMSYHGPFGGTTTYHGFVVGDLKSCLQKYIRRGESFKAVRVILELDRLYIYEQEKGKQIGLRTNMINRLRIMACEDFADSNINMIPLCDKYLNIWIANRDTNYITGTKALIRLIKIFEQVNKSRMISFIRATYKNGIKKQEVITKYGVIYDNINTHIHDITLDTSPLIKKKCAKRFKRSRCEYVLWEYLLDKYSGDTKFEELININLEWFKSSSQKEFWIFLINTIKICMKKYNYNDDATIIDDDISDAEIKNTLLAHLTEPMILDDYCFDQHTKRGRLAGRSHIFFSTIGSKVSNESSKVIQLYKDIYQDLKIISETGSLISNPIPKLHINQWVKYSTPKKILKIKHPKKRKKKTLPEKTKINKPPVNITHIKHILSLYTIEKLSIPEYRKIVALPQGQKLTSTSKKSVYIDYGLVFKGPFTLKDKKFINNLKFTQSLKLVERISGIPKKTQSLLDFKIKHISGYYYLVYKNIGNILKRTADSEITKLRSKSAIELATLIGEPIPSLSVSIYPRGVINRISDIINLDRSKFTNDVKIATLQHLYYRYLLNIGDSGTQNVLYREDVGRSKLIAGVDMEEIRGKDQGNTKLEYLFNSRYNKKIKLFKDNIMDITILDSSLLDDNKKAFAKLGLNINTIKVKINKFNIANNTPI